MDSNRRLDAKETLMAKDRLEKHTALMKPKGTAIQQRAALSPLAARLLRVIKLGMPE